MKNFVRLLLVASLGVGLFVTPARATMDDALSFALEAIGKYIKQGYTLREDTWGGDLPAFQGERLLVLHGLRREGGEDLHSRL